MLQKGPCATSKRHRRGSQRVAWNPDIREAQLVSSFPAASVAPGDTRKDGIKAAIRRAFPACCSNLVKGSTSLMNGAAQGASHRCVCTACPRLDRLKVQPHRIMHKHAELCKWLTTMNHRIWACFLLQDKQILSCSSGGRHRQSESREALWV